MNYNVNLRIVSQSSSQQVSLLVKIMALHIQLAFEGKGVGVKSGVILRGADTSPQHKTNKQKSKYCFWENGMNAAPDTALNTKQTNKKVNIVFVRMGCTLPSQTKNLIHKYIILS